MQGALAVFLIVLGLGQLAAAIWRLRGASLVGPNRWVGITLGLSLLMAGAFILPQSAFVILWTPLMVSLALLILFLAGSYVLPVSHPNSLFLPENPAHCGCRLVQIPDGNELMPGYLLTPPPLERGKTGIGAAVCIVPGAGDNKTFFKWRLVRALLDEGLTVLTIDPPGHGDYRHRPLSYPDCLSALPSAINFLRNQPGITRIGVVGISLGGALAISSLAGPARAGGQLVEALVAFATPIQFNYNLSLLYCEMWRMLYRAPVISLLKETTLKQIRESWKAGGYRSRHSTSELFALLKPLENISHLTAIPILLVYSQRDPIAPLLHAQAMQQAAPHAELIQSKKASHVMLTLIPEIDRQVAGWLRNQLER